VKAVLCSRLFGGVPPGFESNVVGLDISNGGHVEVRCHAASDLPIWKVHFLAGLGHPSPCKAM
jgi:hypothetical protein